jgi:hypothetical protein
MGLTDTPHSTHRRTARGGSIVLGFDALTLLHRHGDEWVPMEEVKPASVDDLDPERRMLRGERVFRCTACEDEVRIGDAVDEG